MHNVEVKKAVYIEIGFVVSSKVNERFFFFFFLRNGRNEQD